MLAQLPNNKDIEDAVLAGFIIENEARGRINELTEDYFYTNINKHIYTAITELIEKEKTVDLITVSDILKTNINNAIEIISQICEFYHIGKLDTYLDKLKEYNDRRKNIKAANELIERMIEEQFDSRLEMKNEVTAMFDIDVNLKNKESYDSQTISNNILEKLDQDLNDDGTNNLYYGLRELDNITAGLHNGEMTVIAAGTGQGKTTFALQAVLNLAIKKKHCVLFSQEMDKEAIGRRMISNMAGIDGNKLRQPKFLSESEKDKFARQSMLFSKLPIHIHDRCSYIEEITEYCHKLKNKGKLDVIVVDYLGLCKSLKGKSSSNREREISYLTWGFKKMAREFNVPLVLLAQLNRSPMNEQRPPRLADLRDSGSIEQDSDVVMFLDEYDDETKEIVLMIAKQRNGTTGDIKLKYYRNTFSFYDIRA